MTLPGQRADQVALGVLSAQAAVVEENLPGCLEGVSPDALHDLRVAVRRSRSVLRQLWRVFPRDQRRAQARSLGWIQDVTGPARDLDVQLLGWEELVGHLSPAARAASEPAHDLLVARRADAFAAMRAQLGSPKFGQRWSAWRSFLAGEVSVASEGQHADRAVEDAVGKRVASLRRRLVKEGSGIDQSSPAEALHDLRKRSKELRYLLELFGDVWSAEAIGPAVRTLKGLQDALGDHQDLEVQIATLRSLQEDLREQGSGVGLASSGDPDERGRDPGDAGPSEGVLRALDQLIDHLHRSQSEARRRFEVGFAAFAAADLPAAVAR